MQSLKDKRVAIWGLGREGWAVLKAIRRECPDLPVTVIDNDLNADAREMLAYDRYVQIVEDDEEIVVALFVHEIVIKSPGVSMYREEVRHARNSGTIFTSATELWLSEPRNARLVGVTGTKGKSTTASLIHHCLVKLGINAGLAGNIGQPMFDVKEEHDIWVLELSSYQLTDLTALFDVALILNLYPEHLDWHGTVERYYADKLHILAGIANPAVCAPHPDRPPAIGLLNAQDAKLLELVSKLSPAPKVRYFNSASSFRAKNDGVFRGSELILAPGSIPLIGVHNYSNIAAALAAIELLGYDARAAAAHVPTFTPLPHRLARVAEKSGVLYVNDSISTVPQSALAALTALQGRPVTILLGGYDRGLDWREFAEQLTKAQPHAVVTMPASGTVIAKELRLLREARAAAGGGAVASSASPAPTPADFPIEESSGLEDAVRRAVRLTPPGGVVLLSPASPSYGHFTSFEARGRRFTELVIVLR